MANLGTVIEFTELVALFRRVNAKIETLLNDIEARDNRKIFAIESIKGHQRCLKSRLDRSVNMFMPRMADDNDDHFEVFVNSREAVIVLKALRIWLTKNEEDVEAQLDSIGEIFWKVVQGTEKHSCIRRANKFLRDIKSPREMLANLLKLRAMPCDEDWKNVEEILARCDELVVEVSLSLVELYIELFLVNNKEEMSKIQAFVSSFEVVSEEAKYREVMKCIVQVLKAAKSELGENGREEGTIRARKSVKDLIREFSDVVIHLDCIMNFSCVPESATSVGEVVRVMDKNLTRIEKEVDSVRRNTENLGIELKCGRFAPLLIGMANTCGLCFEHWIYHGKLRYGVLMFAVSFYILRRFTL